MKPKKAWWCVIIGLILAMMACNLRTEPGAAQADMSVQVTTVVVPLSHTTTLVIPSTRAPTMTMTPLSSVTATPPPSPTLYGCVTPTDDMTRVTLPGGFELSQRTVSMLENAQTLYSGTHDLIGAITQGSYNIGVSASFGTHDGGGAVDLSLRSLIDWNVILYEEADEIILALRRAGFAAWVRDTDSLYPGSPVHIHAIATGDPDLSPAAQSQLTGPEGYFRGFNGLPENTQPDPHGGPILCPWMIELGYGDLRATP